MQAPALATRQHSDFFLLIAAFKVETPEIRPRRHLELSNRHNVETAADRFKNGLVAFERFAALLDHRELDARTDDDLAGVGLLLTGNHSKERRLPRPVGADDTDDCAGCDAKREIVHQQPVAEGFAHARKLDHAIAQPLGNRYENFLRFVAALVLVAGQLFESRDAALTLGLASLGTGADPFEFALERFLTRRFGSFLTGQTLLLLIQPRAVVALPRNAVTAVEL